MTSKIEYANIDEGHVIRLHGDIRYGDVVPLHQLLEGIGNNEKSFVIDLTRCTHLDSTALGTLALVAKKSRSLDQQSRPLIYISKPVVKEALLGVCFDLIFDIVNCDPELKADYELIKNEVNDTETIRKTVAAAHQRLAEISQSNNELFKDVNLLI
ncbi:MAG: STAS domain-containing protein [Gammaproteobacteria bacterium]|nr:STAS domain-containing protein [Gammaproteobacteria bacterium]